jgi:hypothetical protein
MCWPARQGIRLAVGPSRIPCARMLEDCRTNPDHSSRSRPHTIASAKLPVHRVFMSIRQHRLLHIHDEAISVVNTAVAQCDTCCSSDPHLTHEPDVHGACHHCTCTPLHTAVPAALLALHCRYRSVCAAQAAATMAAQCCASAAVRCCHPGSSARTARHVQDTTWLRLQACGEHNRGKLPRCGCEHTVFCARP